MSFCLSSHASPGTWKSFNNHAVGISFPVSHEVWPMWSVPHSCLVYQQQDWSICSSLKTWAGRNTVFDSKFPGGTSAEHTSASRAKRSVLEVGAGQFLQNCSTQEEHRHVSTGCGVTQPTQSWGLLPHMWRQTGVFSKERSEPQILIFTRVHMGCSPNPKSQPCP